MYSKQMYRNVIHRERILSLC